MEWDVFVSHAWEDKAVVAEALVQALHHTGLRVWYDRIELQLGDSLRQRIDEGLSQSRFGIVILSPSFFAKHWPQQELNGLAQREVDGQKVILPIWYDLTALQVRKFSPILADRVAARWSDGIDSVVAQILSVVQGDRKEPKRSNPIVAAPVSAPGETSRDYSSLVLIASEGKNLFVHAEGIESADTLKLDLVPANARERAFLVELGDQRRGEIYLAYDLTAVSGRIESMSHTWTGGKEHWKLEVQREEPAHRMEMSFNNLSADEIAEMRARKILLNENVRRNRGRGRDLNDNLLESFIGGHSAAIEVKESPLPALYRDLKQNPALFVAAARLVAALWLHLSGTVEHIFELDLGIQGSSEIAIRFEGQRRRQYRNSDPAIIRVEGVCKLS